MASTYSPNLRLELIGTGEQQGTWGATTNTNLGTLIEEAIGGYASVTVSNSGDTTLTTANGSADQSRNMTLNLTGTISATRNVICPAIEKIYIVKNATTGGFAVTFKVSGQTGVSIPNGSTVILYVDGTDARLVSQFPVPVTLGGTGTTTSTGSGSVVLSTSPTLTTPSLGTPSSATLTNATGLPIDGGTTGTLSVARGGTGVTTSTGSGSVVLSTSPTLTTPNLGTPSAATLTNATGLPIVAGTTGTLSVARGGTGVTTSTGTGNVVFSTSPVLTTPNLGTPSAITLTNGTGLPLSTGVTGTLPVANGGTGATTASAAATALGLGTGDSPTFTGLTLSGVATLSAGTALLPSLTTSGDLNTGMWFPAADTVAWATGGAERMRIDSSGNVGIGTSGPNVSLEINTATEPITIRTTIGGVTKGQISNYNNDMYFANAGAGAEIFYNNGSERMRIDSSGNVGIGTTSALGTYGKLRVGGTGYQAINAGSDDASGVNVVLAANSSTDARLNVLSNHPLSVFTNNTERFRIGTSGQLGIGGATYGTSGQVLTSQGASSAPVWAIPTTSTVTTYTSGSGNWTIPSEGTTVLVRLWGGGGSGGASATAGNVSTGGGGGAYKERLYLKSDLGSPGGTVAYAVGAGGAAVTGGASNATGNPGGNSSFGSGATLVTAYGGGGGAGGSSAGTGGGYIAAGGTGTDPGWGGSGTGGGANAGTPWAGSNGVGNGTGGSALYGGAGGAGTFAGVAGTGGTSLLGGGSGANGLATAGTAPSGSAPGGGGGGKGGGGTSGAGGAGRVQIFVW